MKFSTLPSLPHCFVSASQEIKEKQAKVDTVVTCYQNEFKSRLATADCGSLEWSETSQNLLSRYTLTSSSTYVCGDVLWLSLTPREITFSY
ncbi:hypothetical protein E2C01_027068 [Portunus trituberculatus]|uniref:Uncharacterized protein n=1 Tax=Portunus trituberculatus TaxID=210409 RepID=A0A5B7EKN7_PORTR|nr:hypothetical protein [Portunus trituberculatus]